MTPNEIQVARVSAAAIAPFRCADCGWWQDTGTSVDYTHTRRERMNRKSGKVTSTNERRVTCADTVACEVRRGTTQPPVPYARPEEKVERAGRLFVHPMPMIREAMFDETGKYRYQLSRIWDPTRPPAVFIMLNPSLANFDAEDPTVFGAIDFALRWNTGGLLVVNVFAYISPYPADLKAAHKAGLDPVGAGNDAHLQAVHRASGISIAAWGAHARFLDRHGDVLKMLRAIKPVHCLAVTEDGYPGHPLYIDRMTPHAPFEGYPFE